MNQWAFVFAAYGVFAVATLGLVLWAWSRMRRFEAEADALKRRP
jgi:uncharacterized membrane protein